MLKDIMKALELVMNLFINFKKISIMLKFILKFILPGFAYRQNKIISTFVKASNDAQKLDDQIREDLLEKDKQIERIQQQMSYVNVIREKNRRFIKNISKLIGDEEDAIVVSPVDDSTNGSVGN